MSSVILYTPDIHFVALIILVMTLVAQHLSQFFIKYLLVPHTF